MPLRLLVVKAENYISGKWSIDPVTARACVELKAATNTTIAGTNKKAGQYYDVDIGCDENDELCKTATAKSDGCSTDTSTSANTETTNQ